MSTKSELMARLGHRAQVRDADPPPSFSGDKIALVLRHEGRMDSGVLVVRRLRAAGLTLSEAAATLNTLCEDGHAVCRIAEGAGIDRLATDLAAMRVSVERKREPDAAAISAIRAKHGLSQRDFADRMGVDVATLRNWEQGRNKPDAAAVNLARLYDRDPDAVLRAVFEPVIPNQAAP
jgi:DNA-binding transcriptional regulator YiaG